MEQILYGGMRELDQEIADLLKIKSIALAEIAEMRRKATLLRRLGIAALIAAVPLTLFGISGFVFAHSIMMPLLTTLVGAGGIFAGVSALRASSEVNEFADAVAS